LKVISLLNYSIWISNSWKSRDNHDCVKEYSVFRDFDIKKYLARGTGITVLKFNSNVPITNDD